MKKRLTMILACLFLFAGMALAQTAVTGTVVSADDGQPVIGASVKVVGSKGGTVTNVDGEFTIIAPEGARLEVSYVGMKPVTVKAGKNMKVVLATDDNLLENVVVHLSGNLPGEVLGCHVGGHGRILTVEQVGVGSLGVVDSGCDLREPRRHDGISSGERGCHEACVEVLLNIGCVDIGTCDIGHHACVESGGSGSPIGESLLVCHECGSGHIRETPCECCVSRCHFKSSSGIL